MTTWLFVTRIDEYYFLVIISSGLVSMTKQITATSFAVVRYSGASVISCGLNQF